MTWEEIHKPIFQLQSMIELKSFIKKEREMKTILPAPSDVMNAFKLTPYDKIRWVILGQDPYPEASYPHGLAFSSLNKNTPGSLKNIFREIIRSLYVDWPEDEYKQIFKHNDLTKWAEQGVLLLNTILTVEEGKPMSHAEKGWEVFTQRIMQSLNDHPRPLVFMFWGKTAQQWNPLIRNPKHLKLFSSHPSPKSVDMGFNGCGHFIEAQRFICDNYFNLRPYINYEKFISDLVAFGKEKNITFGTELIERMPLFTLLKDIQSKTNIDLQLG